MLKAKSKSSGAAQKTKAAKAPKAKPEKAKKAQPELSERQTSFLVRLSLDEQGLTRRTEIEHVQSQKKEHFSSLDAERMAEFMKECIAPEAKRPAPTKSASGKRPQPALDLNISKVDLRILRANPGHSVISSAELEGEVRFQLEGSDAALAARDETSFEIKIYASNLANGTPSLLARYKGNLIKGEMMYSIPLELPKVSPGVYRLTTLVTISAHKAMGYQEKPRVEVLPNYPTSLLPGMASGQASA